jgi:hypothetical protein
MTPSRRSDAVSGAIEAAYALGAPLAQWGSASACFTYPQDSYGELTGVRIAGTRENERDGRYGTGLRVADGATVLGRRMELRDNRSLGVSVTGRGSTLALSDVVVVDTSPQQADGLFGRGLEVAEEADTSLSRAVFRGNHEAAVAIFHEGTALDLSDVELAETAAIGGFGGTGLVAVGGASAHLERFVSHANAFVGLQLARGAWIMAEDGGMWGNVVGLNTNDVSFDPALQFRRVDKPGQRDRRRQLAAAASSGVRAWVRRSLRGPDHSHQPRAALPRQGRVRVAGSQRALEERRGSPAQELRLGGPGQLLADPGQAAQGVAQLRMLRREDLLLDGQRPPVQRLGLGELPARPAQRRQPAAVKGHLEVLRTVAPLEEGEGVPIEPLGFVEPPQIPKDRGQRRPIGHRRRRVWTACPLTDRDRLARVWLGALRAAAGVLQPAQVVV